MSRLFFATRTTHAALDGAEYALMGHLAHNHALAAWQLDEPGGLDNIETILDHSPEPPPDAHDRNLLHHYLRTARRLPDFPTVQRLRQALVAALRVGGLPLLVDGLELGTYDVGFNSVLVNGSDTLAAVTKLYAWDPVWVDGPDRAWLADLLDRGVDTGLLRHDTGWHRPTRGDTGPGVLDLLREHDDEPVVIWPSGGDGFPDAMLAGWHGPWPDTEPERRAWRHADRHWQSLDDTRRWNCALLGLRADRPWTRLAPHTLRSRFFAAPVTAYDILDPDRRRRLRAIVAARRQPIGLPSGGPGRHAVEETGPATR